MIVAAEAYRARTESVSLDERCTSRRGRASPGDQASEEIARSNAPRLPADSPTNGPDSPAPSARSSGREASSVWLGCRRVSAR
jgi:hypothetical protein